MRDIWWIMQKIIRVTFRSKKNIFFYLVTPLLGILIAFLAFTNQTQDMTIGVVNHDDGEIATETITFLKQLDHVKVKSVKDVDVKKQVTSGEIAAVVTIGKGYSESVLQQKPEHIAITSMKGKSVTGFIKPYLDQYIGHFVKLSMGADGDKQLMQQLVHNYQQSDFHMHTNVLSDAETDKDMSMTTIGFLMMMMMFAAANLSEIILAEKENRTYFRLLSTPITARKYMIANVLVNMLVMVIQVTLTLLILEYVFQINLHIPFWQAFIVMVLFSLIAVALSLVIVAFAGSRASSSALTNLIITPTIMLSGCFWPVEIMPDYAQKVSEFLPQRWTLETLTQLQTGSSLPDMFMNILILLGFAAALFLVAVYKFNHNNSVKSVI